MDLPLPPAADDVALLLEEDDPDPDPRIGVPAPDPGSGSEEEEPLDLPVGCLRYHFTAMDLAAVQLAMVRPARAPPPASIAAHLVAAIAPMPLCKDHDLSPSAQRAVVASFVGSHRRACLQAASQPAALPTLVRWLSAYASSLSAALTSADASNRRPHRGPPPVGPPGGGGQ